MIIEFNKSRLEYLLSLYDMSFDELMKKINSGRKKQFSQTELFSNEIELNLLKRIDKIFEKGLEYYLNPRAIEKKPEASIFFRKDQFKSKLNIGAKKIVNKYEDLKNSLSAISKLSEIKIERKLPFYTVNDEPNLVAKNLKKIFYPDNQEINLREFLKNLISKFADNNILVFEFVETWNKIETANINGFYLKPNVIVLKRQQKSFRREIFTLIHELGHYLLNEEEIEEVDVSTFSNSDLSKIENWCNNFAYFFLVGENKSLIDNMSQPTIFNNYQNDLILEISKKTHLSKLALYTRLLTSKKITYDTYNVIKDKLDKEYRSRLEDEIRIKEQEKKLGIKRKGSIPKPINSPLYINTLQVALYNGIINEFDFCKKLNINPNKINQYI